MNKTSRLALHHITCISERNPGCEEDSNNVTDESTDHVTSPSFVQTIHLKFNQASSFNSIVSSFWMNVNQLTSFYSILLN